MTVFVECDPSDGIFNGFRRADGFYEGFCRELLAGLLAEMPWLEAVEFDAWSSVKKSGAMMRTLLEVTAYQNRAVTWGPERGWSDGVDDMETNDGSGGAVNSTSILGNLGMPGVVVVA
jgi:hypothetical protein